MRKRTGIIGVYLALLSIFTGFFTPAKSQDFGVHIGPAMAFPIGYNDKNPYKPLTGFKIAGGYMMEETMFPETALLSLGFSYFLPQKQTLLTPVINSNGSWEEIMLRSQSDYWQLTLHNGWEIIQPNPQLMLLVQAGLGYHRFSTTYEPADLSRNGVRLNANEALRTDQRNVVRTSPFSGDIQFSVHYKINHISLFAQAGYQLLISNGLRSEYRAFIPHFSTHMVVASAGLFIRLYTY